MNDTISLDAKVVGSGDGDVSAAGSTHTDVGTDTGARSVVGFEI